MRMQSLGFSRFLKLTLKVSFVLVLFRNVVEIFEEIARFVSFTRLIFFISQSDIFFVSFLFFVGLLLNLFDHESVSNLSDTFFTIFLFSCDLFVLEMASNLPFAMGSFLSLFLFGEFSSVSHSFGINLENFSRRLCLTCAYSYWDCFFKLECRNILSSNCSLFSQPFWSKMNVAQLI